MGISGALYAAYYHFLKDDVGYITNYIFAHIAFLPIHALVLGVILESLISYNETRQRNKKLKVFLGVFFRQMGVDIFVHLVQLVENREEFDQIIVVDKNWRKADFLRAQLKLEQIKLDIRSEGPALHRVIDLLHTREDEILAMTRNPYLLDFESLYRANIGLFHLLEETHFRRSIEHMHRGELEHLAKDVGKALKMLTALWLEYLEHLKDEHPVLFHYQVGIHNTIQPYYEDQEED